MNSRFLFWLLTTVLLTTVSFVRAQQPTKVPRIGLLFTASASAAAPRIEAFRRGLRELGYAEGNNILLESRYAEGKLDRLPALAAELVRLKVDVIVTAAPSPTRAAKKATSTTPIVMAFDTDPVGNGFIASLARPGGNITGLSALSPEISGKQLELLKEIVPRLSRVAVLRTLLPAATMSKEIELAAVALKLKLQDLEVRGPKDIEAAFREARKASADAVLVLSSPILESHRTQLANLACSLVSEDKLWPFRPRAGCRRCTHIWNLSMPADHVLWSKPC